MNLKKAKQLRRALRDRGIDPTQARHKARLHKGRLGVVEQCVLDPNCGRGLYRQMKRVARHA